MPLHMPRPVGSCGFGATSFSATVRAPSLRHPPLAREPWARRCVADGSWPHAAEHLEGPCDSGSHVSCAGHVRGAFHVNTRGAGMVPRNEAWQTFYRGKHRRPSVGCHHM